MSGASLFHEGAQPRKQRADYDFAPTQERMGPQRVPRRNPSTDQKKARTQMSRQSTKESTMAHEITEAEYLQRIASAPTLVEQQRLSAELAALRQQRSAAARAQSVAGNVREALSRVASAPPAFAHHSITSDWLAEAAVTGADPRSVEATMRAEASLWYEGRPEAVKASPDEVRAQAHGMATRTASQYGEAAPGAKAAFLAQVAHLSKVAMDEVQDVKDTHVPSGSSLPAAGDNKDTFDDSLLTAPGGPDPQTDKGDSASLSEGDSPEGDAAQGIENPAVDASHDAGPGETGYTDPNPSGGKTSRRVVADDQTSTEADKGDTPSLGEGASPEGDHAEPVIEGPKGTGHVEDGGNAEAVDSIDGTVYRKQSLREIAAGITPTTDSAPFVAALGALDSVEGSVAGVPGRDIVGYVLRTATLTEGQRVLLERVATGEVVPPFVRESAEYAGGWGSKESAKTAASKCPECGQNTMEVTSEPGSNPLTGVVRQKCTNCGALRQKRPANKESALTVNPEFAARVQASLSKEAVPSYIPELDADEQYEEGYREGDTAEKVAPPYADGLEDGAEGKPRSRYHEFH